MKHTFKTAILPFVVSLCVTLALAQRPAQPRKEVRFEVFSIRPSAPGAGFDAAEPTPDGYRARMNLWMLLMTAYATGPADAFWGHTEIAGKLPDWAQGFNLYDVQGRVAPEDVEAWRNQGRQHELLQSARQAALKERCKLVVHEEHPLIRDFSLVVGKKGIRFNHSIPRAAPANAMKLRSGGIAVWKGHEEVHFYNATMDDLVAWLNRMCGRTILDRTGLTDRYDFILPYVQDSPRPPPDEYLNFPVASLGLELKPGRGPGTTLIVDHIEKPDAN
jgi:uncharacterized protein (TIGR03435 family)